MKGRHTALAVAALAASALLGGCTLGPPPMVEWEDMPAVYEYEKPCRWDPYVRKRVYRIAPEDYWRLRDLRARPHLYRIVPEDECYPADEIRVYPRKPVPRLYDGVRPVVPRPEPYGTPGDTYNPLPPLEYAPLRR